MLCSGYQKISFSLGNFHILVGNSDSLGFRTRAFVASPKSADVLSSTRHKFHVLESGRTGQNILFSST